jgi:hypothetical protein
MSLLFVLLVGVVALGFYRGWFALSSSRTSARMPISCLQR